MDLGLTKKAVALKLKKMALEIREPSGFVGNASNLLANTVGNVMNTPTALLIGQENAPAFYSNFNKKELEKEVGHLKKDPRLKNVLVRLGHSDIVDDYKRLFKNQNIDPVLKVVGALQIPFHNTAIHRSNHYNPLTNAVELYGKVPEIAHHELGHARDFNETSERATNLMLGQAVENAILGRFGITAGPFTQMLESNANTEAEKGYKGNMQEFRRKLWPARGTYWSGLLAGLAMLHPDVREKARDFVFPQDHDAGAVEKYLRMLALGTGVAGAGALGGRLIAETRNLFDDGKKPTDKKSV